MRERSFGLSSASQLYGLWYRVPRRCGTVEQLFILALAVQVITELYARFWPAYTLFVAAAVGIIVAVISQTGLLASLGIPTIAPWLDYVLAGLAVAGGASVVEKLKKVPEALRGR